MNKKGFTLVELMLVVIIISILVAMVMPRLAGRTDQARSTAARADIDVNIASALDLFELDTGSYPPSLEGLMTNPGNVTGWRGPYIKKMPKDPWGRNYEYKCPGDHGNDYDLYSTGKDGQSGGSDDITNWDNSGTQG